MKSIANGTLAALTLIAGPNFSLGAFAFYAPRLYKYYVNTLRKLYASDPDLEPPFYGAIWPNDSPNSGKKSCAFLHNDHNNLAFGWCAIQSFGKFNHQRGGHLILQQFGVVAEFPAGSTALIPSSVVTHGNTPIAEDETRHSIVSYRSSFYARAAASDGGSAPAARTTPFSILGCASSLPVFKA